MKPRVLLENGKFENWTEKKYGKLPKPAQIKRQDIVMAERKRHEDACLKGGFNPDNPSDQHPGTLYAEDKILIRAGMLVPDLMYLAKARKIKLHPDLDSKEAIAEHILKAQTYVVEDDVAAQNVLAAKSDVVVTPTMMKGVDKLVKELSDEDLENAEDSPNIVDPRNDTSASAPAPTNYLSEENKAKVLNGDVTITVMKHMAKQIGVEVPKGIISKTKMIELLTGVQQVDSGL